jgi:hypothetical protein
MPCASPALGTCSQLWEESEMGDEADADWQDGLVEWGIEDTKNAIRDQFYRGKRNKGARCSGSTSVSKTEGRGSIPRASAKSGEMS